VPPYLQRSPLLFCNGEVVREVVTYWIFGEDGPQVWIVLPVIQRTRARQESPAVAHERANAHPRTPQRYSRQWSCTSAFSPPRNRVAAYDGMREPKRTGGQNNRKRHFVAPWYVLLHCAAPTAR
jgi:hypothetical protein